MGGLKPAATEVVQWRQQLLPSSNLLVPLRERAVTKVVIAGLKAGTGVLAACQLLADDGLLCYVVRECVGDDNEERRRAVLDHVLPQFADVLGVDEFRTQISQEIMMDMYVEMK